MDDAKKILKFLQHKIRHKRDSTLWTHIKTILGIGYDYAGKVKEDEFTIWNYDQWQGAFYTVIFGRVISKNNSTIIRISTKLNSFGFLLAIIIASGFFTGMLFENGTDISIGRFFLSLLFASLPILAGRLGYRNHRKKIVARFVEMIKNIAPDSQIEIS